MIDDKLNDFAICCFRDLGDEDYISARMAFRAALVTPSLWASQQAVEKYLKCILLLNRIPGAHVRHKLAAALDAIKGSGKLLLELNTSNSRLRRVPR
jgi:HEPN domain-containing protein